VRVGSPQKQLALKMARNIIVDQVIKRAGSFTILDAVSLVVPAKTVTGIIGPSGSGKSSLLRCMNFIEDFQEGFIHIGEDPVGYRQDDKGHRVRCSETEINALRQKAGMVFQSFNLFPHLSALDNVALAPIRVKKKPRSDARELASTLLSKVGLGDWADRLPRTLSGGQQQRVAIARALAMEPEVLLLDEVTSALDPELVGEVLEVIQQLAAEGMTMVIVTHEMAFAEQVADQVIFMEGGRIAEQGTAADVMWNAESDRLRQFLQRYRKTM
jgi:polar amino acid transport system ATP-binding protein